MILANKVFEHSDILAISNADPESKIYRNGPDKTELAAGFRVTVTDVSSLCTAGLQAPTHVVVGQHFIAQNLVRLDLARGGRGTAVSGTPGMLKLTFRCALRDFDGLAQLVHALASSAGSGTNLIVAPLGMEAWGSNPYSVSVISPTFNG